MDSLMRDLSYALRQMGRAPFLSAATFFVLAAGIGTNAVIFSVLDGILFRGPPGVEDTDRLVEVSSISASGRMSSSALTYREYLAYRDQREVFAEVAVFHQTQVALRTDRGLETVRAELVSSAYFAALDLRMELGAGFVPADDRRLAGAAHTVLGYAFWQSQLGGSPDVVGRSIEVNGHPYTVIGVAPERFYGAGEGDSPISLWLPAADHPRLFPGEPDLLVDDQGAFQVVARLAEGVTLAQAQAVTEATWRRLARATTDGANAERRRSSVTPYRGMGSRRAQEAFAVVGLVGGLIGGLVLLIACANASALLLARALGRRREIAVRLALGAGRGRIVRQLITEGLLIALVAGAVGVALTYSGLEILERALFTFPVDLAPGLATLALALGVTVATGLGFSLTPAFHATRAVVFTALRGDHAGFGLRSSRLRNGFAVAQLALSLPLLTAAGLLIGQLIGEAEYRFADPDGILMMRIDLRQSAYASDEVGPLLLRIRERVAALPGVAGAAFASGAPFTGGGVRRIARLPTAVGDPRESTVARPLRVAVVDPEYFGTLGVPILRGRAIEESDVPGAPLVAVIDEAVAQRAWPGEDPLGRTLTMEAAGDESPITVVGVSGSMVAAAQGSFGTWVVYAARQQIPDTTSVTLVVRGEGGAASALAPVVRSEIGRTGPDLVVNASLLADRLRAYRAELAHASAGAAASGLIALLLACVGLYAMIATGVTEHTREIGVRIALGADRRSVIHHFVRKGLGLTVVALGVGLPLSWVTVGLVGAGVVGVSASSPEVVLGLGAVAILMTVVALVSSWLPARRSSSVDPVLALRAE